MRSQLYGRNFGYHFRLISTHEALETKAQVHQIANVPRVKAGYISRLNLISHFYSVSDQKISFKFTDSSLLSKTIFKILFLRYFAVLLGE